MNATNDFYPTPAIVPDRLTTERLLLEPLNADHVERDYDAVMASRALLRNWGQTDWPADGFTLKENLADLVSHDEEHRQRVAFTYTVMDPAAETCLGCVYINPLARTLARISGADPTLVTHPAGTAIVTYWIRTPHQDGDLDRHLVQNLLGWFDADWSFDAHFIMTNETMLRQIDVLTSFDLDLRYILRREDRPATLLLYGRPPF